MHGICCLQMVLLQQGALTQIVPLLFVFDATHSDRDHPPVFDFGGSPQYRAAGYLATSTEHSNMQVGIPAEDFLHMRLLLGLYSVAPADYQPQAYIHAGRQPT